MTLARPTLTTRLSLPNTARKPLYTPGAWRFSQNWADKKNVLPKMPSFAKGGQRSQVQGSARSTPGHSRSTCSQTSEMLRWQALSSIAECTTTRPKRSKKSRMPAWSSATKDRTKPSASTGKSHNSPTALIANALLSSRRKSLSRLFPVAANSFNRHVSAKNSISNAASFSARVDVSRRTLGTQSSSLGGDGREPHRPAPMPQGCQPCGGGPPTTHGQWRRDGLFGLPPWTLETKQA
mmetsp:Transcript_55326/g.160585  ORF Transcript_55326/g.160585 Transcript_55326/m.160585 type:complete len:237 (+) Transcript_55326:719-1429(+)